jgi:hypothetical protein
VSKFIHGPTSDVALNVRKSSKKPKAAFPLGVWNELPEGFMLVGNPNPFHKRGENKRVESSS